MEKINIQFEKGNIAAVIHRPEAESGRLAILCPGYVDSKDYAHLVGLAYTLAEKGYVVVRFDPIGTWESGEKIADYTVTQYLQDIKNVLEYMLSQKSYDQILLGGHSRGGQLSILYAARDPRITMVLGIMASPGGAIDSEIVEKWKKAGEKVSTRDLPEDASQTKELRVPFSYAEDSQQYDAVAEVKKIAVPVILIAGELDTVVLPEDVEAIYNNANDPKKFVVIPGIGHDYRLDNEEIKIVNGKILDLIDE